MPLDTDETVNMSLACMRVAPCVKKEEVFWRRSLTQQGSLLSWIATKAAVVHLAAQEPFRPEGKPKGCPQV